MNCSSKRTCWLFVIACVLSAVGAVSAPTRSTRGQDEPAAAKDRAAARDKAVHGGGTEAPPAGSAEGQAVDPGEGFSLLGTIRPRHAREIASSDWSVGAETMDRDFTIYRHWREHLGPLGAKKARIQSGWAKTEREAGRYDWAWLDEIILDMVDQGVEPWICLSYGNPVYPGGGGTGLGGGLPSSPEALAAWDRFVAAIVDRYQEHVDEWEIWNEPGLRGANSEDAYASLLIRTAEVIRGRQPQAKIVALAMAGIKLPWVEGILNRVRQAGKLDLIDEVSYHPYSYNPDDSYAAVEKLSALVAGYSPGIRLRQGENGAPSARGSFGALADYDWSEERQAKWALRRLLGDLGRDIPSSYFAICDMQYPDRLNTKGLLAVNPDRTVHQAKQAYRAVRHVTSLFDGSLQRLTRVDANIDAGKPADYTLFGYRSANGAVLVTLWRSSDAPGKRTELEQLAVSLPGLRFDDPIWIDLLSGRIYDIGDALWKPVGNGTSFARVPVYDSVIVLADRSAIAAMQP